MGACSKRIHKRSHQKWSFFCGRGDMIGLIFFKNLRRCVGFFRRYFRLACAYSPVLLRKLALLRSLYFASITCFVNSPRFAYASLLINKTSPLVVKTTFRGCFYPRALPRMFEPAAQKQYKKTPPEKVAFFYNGRVYGTF